MNLFTPKRGRGRPPKTLTNNQDVKSMMIRSGLEHLTEFGFMASGIDQILKKIGVPKGSFYYYFSSKEEFGRTVIENYANFFATKLDSFLLDKTKCPLERIKHFIENASSGMQRFEFKRGCLIGNLGQEVDSLPESFRPMIIAVFATWQHKISKCLKEAQSQNKISSTADCEQLAEYFWIGWEGAVARAKLEKSTKPLNLYFTYFISGLPR